MVRKSKGFNELLETQKRTQQQQKFLESFKSKLEREPIGSENVVFSSTEEARMSEVLTNFIAPYRQEVDTEESYQRLLELAVMAWNTALLPEPEQQMMINTMLTEGFPKLNKEIEQGVRDILEQLITRKKQYFSENKRLIIDFELKDTGKDYHLSVASTLSEIS